MLKLGTGWSLCSTMDEVIILKHNVHKKTGKRYTQAKFHYSTLEGAYLGLVERAIQDMDLSNLETVIREIRKLKKDLIKHIDANVDLDPQNNRVIMHAFNQVRKDIMDYIAKGAQKK